MCMENFNGELFRCCQSFFFDQPYWVGLLQWQLELSVKKIKTVRGDVFVLVCGFPQEQKINACVHGVGVLILLHR